MLNVDLNISCWRFLYVRIPCSLSTFAKVYFWIIHGDHFGGAIFNDDVQLVISISFFTSIETIEWYHRFSISRFLERERLKMSSVIIFNNGEEVGIVRHGRLASSKKVKCKEHFTLVSLSSFNLISSWKVTEQENGRHNRRLRFHHLLELTPS